MDYDIKVVLGRAGRRRHLYALSCQFDINGYQLTKLTDYVYKERSYPNYLDFINKFKKILYSESLNIVMVIDIDDGNE